MPMDTSNARKIANIEEDMIHAAILKGLLKASAIAENALAKGPSFAGNDDVKAERPLSVEALRFLLPFIGTSLTEDPPQQMNDDVLCGDNVSKDVAVNEIGEVGSEPSDATEERKVNGNNNSPLTPNASPLRLAVAFLSDAVARGAMPCLSPVGLLADDAALIAFINECGNAWIRDLRTKLSQAPIVNEDVDGGDGKGKEDAAVAAIVDLCCGATNFAKLVEHCPTTDGGQPPDESAATAPPPHPAAGPNNGSGGGLFLVDTANTLAALKAMCGFGAQQGSPKPQPVTSYTNAKGTQEECIGSAGPHDDDVGCVGGCDSSSSSATTPESSSEVRGFAILSRLVAARLLFRFRITLGTVTAIGCLGLSLPRRAALLESFARPHCPPREVLSVGARALAKHIHRDVSSSWWGDHHLSGSQQKKNAAAEAVLFRILDGVDNLSGITQLTTGNAAIDTSDVAGKAAAADGWRNFHVLPHGRVAYEVRSPMGYGARWQMSTASLGGEGDTSVAARVEMSPDDLTFRGFLEPHDADGHAKGWQH